MYKCVHSSQFFQNSKYLKHHLQNCKETKIYRVLEQYYKISFRWKNIECTQIYWIDIDLPSQQYWLLASSKWFDIYCIEMDEPFATGNTPLRFEHDKYIIMYVEANISSKFSSNCEANSSEVPWNLEEMLPRYYMCLVDHGKLIEWTFHNNYLSRNIINITNYNPVSFIIDLVFTLHKV